MAKKKVPPEKKEKSAAGSALFDAIRERRQYQFNELCDRAKRLEAAAPTRWRLLEGLAQKVGLNLQEMQEQQQKDWQVLLEQTKEQEKAAVGLLKKQTVRQRQALRTIAKHADRFEYKKGNPHTSICLWRAPRPHPASSSIPRPSVKAWSKPCLPSRPRPLSAPARTFSG